jgi:hypothetical protein
VSSIVLAAVVTALPLVVRVYDAVGVPSDTLERAHVAVTQTLHVVRIEPVWRPCRGNT